MCVYCDIDQSEILCFDVFFDTKFSERSLQKICILFTG